MLFEFFSIMTVKLPCNRQWIMLLKFKEFLKLKELFIKTLNKLAILKNIIYNQLNPMNKIKQLSLFLEKIRLVKVFKRRLWDTWEELL